MGTSGDCTYTMFPGATVTENPLPSPSAGSNAPLCLGSTLNLTAERGHSYSWTGPDGFMSSSQNPSISNMSIGNVGTYTATVTDDNGCSASATTDVALLAGVATGGTVSSASVCSGASGTLTLSGNSSNPSGWEYTTDTTSGTWTPVTPNNTSTSLSSPATTVPIFYRAIVSDGCGTSNSSIGVVGIHNYWVGGDLTNPTDWNTPANWSDGQVPSTLLCDDVYIPFQSNQPVVSNSVPAITNLHISLNALLTIDNTGLLHIGGTISNDGIFDVTDGTLELNGTSGAQDIDGNLFKDSTVKNLIISNTVNVANTANDTLNITGALSFGTASAGLNTGNNITLKSSQAATASVGLLAAGNTITGNVTVERYINTGLAGNQHHKTWQLLAIPTTGQTIRDSWMESAGAANANPHPGYGTQITSNVPGAANWPSPGFDALSVSPSMKTYNTLTGGYDGVPETDMPIYDRRGYLVFVRGDRSVTGVNQAANQAILRTTGKLFTLAPNAPPSSSVGAGQFTSVGNPYASALDLRNLSYGAGINKTVIVWDPTLTTGSAYGYGAFQTLVYMAGHYENLLTSTAYGLAGTTNNYIQSGQAFFIQSIGAGGTLTFKESDKAAVNGPLVTTPNPVVINQASLRITLYAVNADGTTELLDGTLSQFDNSYSNAIDGLDARKAMNTAENLAIRTAGKLLVLERRQTLTAQDTIFLNLTGVKVQQYQFHFDAENLDPGLQGYLEDNYLHSRTPLNMTGGTDVNFNMVNIPGAYAADRFRIVFAPLKALPVTFTSIKAYKQDKNITVEWRVDNEMNMKQYEVEKSTNGTDFTTITIQAATANNGGSVAYVASDAGPVEGYNYYRVKSVDVNGKTIYTNVVKVLIGTLKQDITIYPNPVTDGMIHLQLVNEPEGKYKIRLLNKLGQLIVQKQLTHAGGNATGLIKWDYNLAHGMYQLEVTKPDGTVKDINVMY